jgi:tRNA A-37 threonylcarbamoyl transferase component Bud32/tetratricopeptide (TPR) repeat protein
VDEERPGATVEPGALSALLADLVRAPEIEGMAPLQPGALVGRFEIVRELGRGGFGVVYEARDRELNRAVALKVVHVGERAGPREERLLAEAETAARLTHPNIVTLYDVGRTERGPFLVLELLRGRSLTARLAEGPVAPAEAVRISTEVARGMSHAHAAGVAHRDLSPNNVFLCADGQVKILDLGLAHAFGRPRADGGTPAWMAPEQARGAPEDERTDVFALGLILYRLLSGVQAFPTGDRGKALTSAQPAPALEVPAAPELGPLVATLLAKDPVARPRDAGAVLAALGPIDRELQRDATPSGPVRVRRRPRLRLAAIVAVGVVLGAAAAVLVPRLLRPAVLGEATRITIAVADAVNRTGDPQLDDLSGLLVTALEQSRRLSVLSHIRMVDLLAQAGEPRPRVIDERLARQAGRGAGVKAVLLPVIQRIGSVFAVELRAIDPSTEQSLFALSERASSKERVLEIIDRLAVRARRDLHEEEGSIGASQVAVGRAVATSLEAYQHYAAAVQAFEDHDFDRSRDEAREALVVDPNMALAHTWLAWLAEYNLAAGEDAVAHLKAAMATAAELPAKEHRFVEAFELWVQNDVKASEAFLLLAEDFPQEKLLWHFAAMAARTPAEQKRLYLKALELDAAFPWSLYEMIMQRYDPPASQVMARRAVELRPDFKSVFNLSLAQGYAGQRKEALETARRAQSLAPSPRPEVDACVAAALASLDRLPEAAAALESWLLPGVNDGSYHVALVPLMLIESLQGKRGAALRSYANDQRVERSNPWGEVWMFAGIGGDDEAVRKALLKVKAPGRELVTPFVQHGLIEEGRALARKHLGMMPMPADWEASLEWKVGNAAAAAPRYRAFFEKNGRRPDHVAYILGRMLADAGRCADAIVQFDSLSELYPWWGSPKALWGVRMPLSLLEGARCHVKLGQPELARQKLERLLLLWKDADADLPALAEARALGRTI